MSFESRQSEPSWVRWAPAALLVGVAISSLFLQAFVFDDPTEASDWKSASEDVLERVGDDEAVVVRVHPTWNDSARVHLTEVGAQLDTKRSLILEDLVGVDSFVVMAEKGRRDEALGAFPIELQAQEVRQFGTVETFRVEAPSPKVGFNMRESLDQAEVRRRSGSRTTPCTTWDSSERRWDCERRERWLYVADELREVGDEPRRCIYAHPLGGSTVLEFEWKDVELGESFRLRSGIDLRAARASRGDDVRISLFIDSRRAATREVPHRSETWYLDEVETEPGERADLRVEIRTGDRFERFFCFDGWVWNETID